MLSIRLSEEEYAALRRLCLVAGARSVSDLAREAMHMLLSGASREDFPASHMDEFRSQLRNLDRKIEQLSAEITASRANSNQ
jgi:outer membrane murein-binding lipoprotein Lpp